ncbi:AAA ATPase [Dimargaris cristalligena]|nr:AAA ATPase [Dimargaris cristalligena]
MLFLLMPRSRNSSLQGSSDDLKNYNRETTNAILTFSDNDKYRCTVLSQTTSRPCITITRQTAKRLITLMHDEDIPDPAQPNTQGPDGQPVNAVYIRLSILNGSASSLQSESAQPLDPKLLQYLRLINTKREPLSTLQRASGQQHSEYTTGRTTTECQGSQINETVDLGQKKPRLKFAHQFGLATDDTSPTNGPLNLTTDGNQKAKVTFTMSATGTQGKDGTSRCSNGDNTCSICLDDMVRKQKEAKLIFRRASQPSCLVGRESEQQTIRQFLTNHVVGNQPNSLYISGQPGTGKTASLLSICLQMRGAFKGAKQPIKLLVINCMTVENPQSFYARLATEIVGEPVTIKDALKVLEALFLNPKRKTLYLVVLDEIDSLLTRNQDILYKLFEWPTLPGSRLTLIGIANALNLTDRFLPRLKAKDCMPQLLNFNPYQVTDISAIIKGRLVEVNGNSMPAPQRRKPGPKSKTKPDPADSGCEAGGNSPDRTSLKELSLIDTQPLLIEVPAIELCARKVAAATGDLRKALDICRQAIELAELEYLKQAPPSNPTAILDSPVTMLHMLKVLQSAFGTPTITKIKSLSFQQKLLLCTAALYTARRKSALTLGKLHEEYMSQCKLTDVVGAVSRLEFFDLATTLDSFGLISIAASRNELSRRVSLAVQIAELTHAVADVPILQSLLQDQLPA